MKYIVSLLMLLSVGGCAMVNTSFTPQASPQKGVGVLTLGMHRAEVAAMMDASVVVGYATDPVSGILKPVESKNLYSSEALEIAGVSYQLDRYIVHPPVSARVSDTELYPVVYKNDILVAKGFDGLAELKAKK